MATKDEEMLLDQVAQHYRQMIGESMPRISEAMDSDEARQASFTVTVTFTRGKKDGVTAKIMPRERIPMPGIELKLEIDDGQIALFGGHGAPKVVVPGKGMGDNEDEAQGAGPAAPH